MKTTVTDKFGLTPEELAHIRENAEGMGFDFVRYADELEIYVTPHTPCEGETWHPEFDVLIEGTSEYDERGNGYFGYGLSRELLHNETSK